MVLREALEKYQHLGAIDLKNLLFFLIVSFRL